MAIYSGFLLLINELTQVSFEAAVDFKQVEQLSVEDEKVVEVIMSSYFLHPHVPGKEKLCNHLKEICGPTKWQSLFKSMVSQAFERTIGFSSENLAMKKACTTNLCHTAKMLQDAYGIKIEYYHLDLSTEADGPETLAFLISKHAPTLKEQEWLLSVSCLHGKIAIVDYLCRTFPHLAIDKVFDNLWSPLHTACHHDQLELVKWLTGAIKKKYPDNWKEIMQKPVKNTTLMEATKYSPRIAAYFKSIF